MNGPEHAADLVATALADRLPARLADLEVRLGLDAGELAPPKHVFASDVDRLAIGADFPAVLVVAQEGRSAGEAEVDAELDDPFAPGAGALLLVEYPLRVFVWAAVRDAKGGSPRDRQELVDLARKRYTLAVREALLANLALGAGARLIAAFRESYSDIAVDDRAKLTLAASYVEVTASLEERVTQVPDNTYVPAGPRTVVIDTELLP